NKEYVFDVLSKNKPKFIIITPNSFRFPELSDFVQKNYYLISEVDSSQIWLYIKK
ncbi:MAG: hypothetical protein UR20_C0047G0001, partial [Candidatus Woesebacteria bacterium GW2011_GWE2_31_6]